MLDLHFTRHANARMRQRGFRDSDIDLVFNTATQVTDDAFVLTDVDTAREIEKRRREIQQLERLRGSKLIIKAGTLITLYHTEPGRSHSRISKHRRHS
jgi:hypothetical protein